MHRLQFAASILLALTLGLAIAACGDGPDTPPKSPTANASASPSASASPVEVPTPAEGVAGPCPAIASDKQISILMGRTMTPASSPQASIPGAQGAYSCRWEAVKNGTQDQDLILLLARYPDVTTAINSIAKGRLDSQAQGYTFTKMEGVGDESYFVRSSNFRGANTRKGSLGIIVSVGTSFTNVTDDAVKDFVKQLVDKGN